MSKASSPDAYVMIIGAMKAGTSSLFQLLKEHPAICPARSKEPEFFSQHQGHALDVPRYEDLFVMSSDEHRLCLEASTGYTKYPEEVGVPRRIKEYGLKPKFIYLVRDPVARTVSHIYYARLNNHPWASDPLFGFYAATFSMYYKQLSEYLEHFPDQDQYFIADFEDLKEDPVQLTKMIHQWLGLEPLTTSLGGPANVTPPRSKAELAILKSPLHRMRGVLPTSVRSHLKTFLRARGESARTDLTLTDKERLHEWFREDMAAFAGAFDFPVSMWGFEG